jgi:hypothetical protein
MALRRLRRLHAAALLGLATFLVACLTPGLASGGDDSGPGMVQQSAPANLHWADRIYRWHYNDALRPDWLPPGAALDLFRAAAGMWQACGVALEFAGETVLPAGRMDGTSVVGWSATLPRGHRGLTLRRSARELLAEADVMISATNPELRASPELLRKVVMHEFGHALGLVHSTDCADVMSFGSACRGIPPANLPSRLAQGDLVQCANRYPVQSAAP